MEIPEKAKDSVNEMQNFLISQSIYLNEEQVFKKLVEYEMLDKFGNPTQYALDNGFVEIS